MLWLKIAADQGEQDVAVSFAVAYGAGDDVDQPPIFLIVCQIGRQNIKDEARNALRLFGGRAE